ncbi:type IV pilus biogenesis protein PilM [Bowmanella dokdonensis]|uniref:MSHA biogenesis protein MshI n=1 Tax=Bowmanella dokdonensis TaxID=751969 RepID=A0A939IRV7_9ALTE|nr:MSHA biogenesis protein MshI [Bowmanella dokdonensis]MBN7826052.1 MSHA biogenesis protein MshI [Bowmanella dokdonensis]
MRLGWWDLVKRKLRKPAAYHSLGIEFGQRNLNLSLLGKQKGLPLWLKQHRIGIDNWVKDLTAWIKDEGVASTPCHVVFSTNRYQLLQVEKPAVPAEELTQALRWSVKDLLASADDMVVEYFDLPAQPTGSNKINLVAAPKSLIESVVTGMIQAGVELKSIGIEELSQCDLLDAQPAAQITLVQEPGEEICLSIIKDGNIYFTRRLKGYEQLSSYGLEQIHQGVADSLSIEIQRSMDYFDSQLRQAPVKRLLICIDTPFLEELSQVLEQNTLVKTEMFTPQIATSQGLRFSSETVTSLGAAMRQVREANA